METLRSQPFAKNFYDSMLEKQKNPEKYRGWKTGIPELDKYTGGIGKGWFVVIGAKQKGGKTALLTTFAKQTGRLGIPTLWVGLEMNNEQIAARVFSNVSGIELSKFRDLRLEDGDWKLMDKAYAEISRYSSSWNYGASRLDQIERLIEEAKPEVVMLDYLQLMESSERVRHEQVSKISRSLKLLTLSDNAKKPEGRYGAAQEVGSGGMTIIAASQVNRDAIRNGKLDGNSFLGSGSIERDCDLALMLDDLYDPEGIQVPNKKRMSIVESRVSEKGDWEVHFNGARSLIAGSADNNINEPAYDRQSGNRWNRETLTLEI